MNTLLKNSNLLAKVCAIQYIPCSDVVSVKRGSSNFSRVINFLSGKTWLNLYSTPASIKFTQKSETTGAGTFYDQKVELNYPGLDVANLEDLFNTDYTEFILKLIYTNGDEYLVGDKERPARFTDKFSTENSASAFVFSCKNYQKACKYEN